MFHNVFLGKYLFRKLISYLSREESSYDIIFLYRTQDPNMCLLQRTKYCCGHFFLVRITTCPEIIDLDDSFHFNVSNSEVKDFVKCAACSQHDFRYKSRSRRQCPACREHYQEPHFGNWECPLCRKQDNTTPHLALTAKDTELLFRDPHLFIDGVLRNMGVGEKDPSKWCFSEI